MLKILKSFLRRLNPLLPASVQPRWSDGETWWRDPLSHPDLRCMTQRQLGDLPIEPRRIHPHH